MEKIEEITKPAGPRLVKIEMTQEAAMGLRQILDRVPVTGAREAQGLVALAMTVEAALAQFQREGSK